MVDLRPSNVDQNWDTNLHIRKHCNEKILLVGLDLSILKWFGHVNRIEGRDGKNLFKMGGPRQEGR